MSATIDIPYGKTGQPPRSRMSYGNSVDSKVAELLRLKISKRPLNAPLFELSDSCAARQTGILDGHMGVNSASIYLMKTIGKLFLGFHLNPYRFRYSVGTEAYRETGNPYITARVLRHSDIQNVIVYINEIVLAQAHDRVAAEVFKDISEVIGAGVKAKTFSGVVITKQVFKKGDLSTVRAREELGNFDPIGGCAGGIRCAQGVPVACYCCLKFRPIKEADHHGMLKATLANYFLFFEKDEKIASSLIPPILGMAQVCYLITTS
ncbi:site-specific integrase [Zoogloea oleivorans]|uniref:Site-specific integrase n=1 Tax=Zoogloea oleivorans TaxID=1552750 RepID=A0A6C2D3Q7_9RHOO|nr:site-specific integrase [Zoogloea oleivorans]TYC60282.1 site-specific integrase [Zoogloea oleivorans]